MAEVLGLKCKAYLNTGTTIAPDWEERSTVTSVSVSNSTATADVTRRGNNGYRAQVPTLSEGSVTTEIIYDSTDAFYGEISAAFRDRTTLDLWFGTGAIGTDGNIGFRAAFSVTDFSESQELEDAVRYSVTFSVTGVAPVPGYYESATSALVLIETA